MEIVIEHGDKYFKFLGRTESGFEYFLIPVEEFREAVTHILAIEKSEHIKTGVSNENI